MSSDISELLTPFDVAGLRLPNRFVMAPMTRMFSPGGVPGDDVVEYYRKRAAGGVGLIITEGAFIDDPAVGAGRRVPHLWGEDAAAGWTKVVEAVHAEGGKIFPQLWHQGIARGEHSRFRADVESVSPSGVGFDGKPFGRELTAADLDNLVTAFASAAAFAQDVGFDGVELHGAHGYLLDEFLWRTTNRRSDEYGEVSAFPARVTAAVRAAVGSGYPISFRFSQWKSSDFGATIADSPDELADILTTLVDAGADLLHPSTRRFWLPAFAGHDPELTLAGWTRKLTGVPTIAVGSVGLDSVFNDGGVGVAPGGVSGIDNLVERFERDEFDLVSVGRALLSDPEWVNKHAAGRDDIVAYDPSFRENLI